MVQQAVAPITALNMEQFRRAWEPQGWQLLVIGPTATWRTDWGEWEAIRDIVQNALDETEDYSWGYDDLGLYIRDVGKGIGVADFLLGPPKPKPAYARGRFGEGMKLASLALLRKGYAVKVDTVGKEVWIVFLTVRVNGSADQLAALWRLDGRGHGTVFHIIGYKGDAFADRFVFNLPKKNILHQGRSPLLEPIPRFNMILSSPPGRIYARDIYMRDMESPFSYNLWGFELAPDRHAPKEESRMWTDMGRTWATCTSVKLLERFLGMVKRPPEEETDESGNISMGAWDMGTEPFSKRDYTNFIKENAAAWQEAWRRKMGENTLLRTSDRWDGTVKHLGYKPVSVSYGVESALSRAIKTDTDLVRESQERLREAEVIPDDRLTARQLTHLKLIRAIASKWRYPPVAGVHAAIIPPASDRMRTAGLYSKITQEILISGDHLEHARPAVDVLIHELAHHTSGVEDGEAAHNTEMTAVGSRVVELVVSGVFDEELKGATW